MAVHFQCARCGRTFWSSGSSLCFSCGSTAQSSVNSATDTIMWVLVFVLAGLFIWFYFIVPAFTLIALAFSIAPMAFGILAAYLVALVTSENMPPVAAEALPALGFLFTCFVLRFLLFLWGKGRAGLISVGVYFSIALSVALVLAYTGMRPFGFDVLSSASGVPGLIEGRAWVFEYVSFGKLPGLVAAYESYAAFAAGFDSNLLAVSLVVYWFILPVEVVLVIVAWFMYVERRDARIRAQGDKQISDATEQDAAPEVESPDSPPRSGLK